MTDDTRCGAECTDGTPCENDADSCPWHGTDDPPDTGRPSLLDDYRDDIIEGAEMGMTLQGCARLAGVDESTLHRWINRYDEFRKSLRRARANGEQRHLQTVDDRGSQFILERSFGYTKSQEIEHSGEVDVEVEADFSDTST